MTKGTRQKIELSAKKKAEIAKAFGVTIQCVSQALLYRRNSAKAEKIRMAALENGGAMVQIIDVTEEFKKAVKVLDAKGNVVRTL